MIYKPLASADLRGVKELSFICKSGLFKYMEEMKKIWQNVICITSVASSWVFHLTSYNVLCLDCFLVLNHVLMIFVLFQKVELKLHVDRPCDPVTLLWRIYSIEFWRALSKKATQRIVNDWWLTTDPQQWVGRRIELRCACGRQSHSAVRGITPTV